MIKLYFIDIRKFQKYKLIKCCSHTPFKAEPVDFSRNEANKSASNTGDKRGPTDESERAFSLYSSMGVKSLKAQTSIQMLRSISSDDLMKSSDSGTEDESDVDIIGETKGYIS